MLLSEIEYVSLFSYVSGPEGKRLYPTYHNFVFPTLKQDKMMDGGIRASSFVANELKTSEFTELFSERVLLVPAPASSKTFEGQVRVTKNLTSEMAKQGLGTIADCIERMSAVNKAAWSAPTDRPTPQEHYDTIQVLRTVHDPDLIVIVDDVVTQGATLLACASRLQERWPRTKIIGFAVVRTVSNPGAFVAFRDPQRGTIQLRGSRTQRTP